MSALEKWPSKYFRLLEMMAGNGHDPTDGRPAGQDEIFTNHILRCHYPLREPCSSSAQQSKKNISVKVKPLQL